MLAILIDSAVAFVDNASIKKVAVFNRAVSSVIASFVDGGMNAVIIAIKVGVANILSASNIVIAPRVSRNVVASSLVASVFSALNSVIASRDVELSLASILSASVDVADDIVLALGVVGGEGATLSLGTFIDSAADVVVAKIVIELDLAVSILVAPVSSAVEAILAKAVGGHVLAVLYRIAIVDSAINAIVAIGIERSIDASLEVILIANVVGAFNIVVARTNDNIERARSVGLLASVVGTEDVIVADLLDVNASFSVTVSSNAEILSAGIAIVAICVVVGSKASLLKIAGIDGAALAIVVAKFVDGSVNTVASSRFRASSVGSADNVIVANDVGFLAAKDGIAPVDSALFTVVAVSVVGDRFALSEFRRASFVGTVVGVVAQVVHSKGNALAANASVEKASSVGSVANNRNGFASQFDIAVVVHARVSL